MSKVLAESGNPAEDSKLPEEMREELSSIRSEKDLKKFMKKNSVQAMIRQQIIEWSLWEL